MENKYCCHDCKKTIKTDGENIVDGVQLLYDNEGEKVQIMKCSFCYEKDKSLKNYKKCEVYSRIVGYLRPIQQWNAGKEQEFKERKNYKI
jgi:hypothetical protein